MYCNFTMNISEIILEIIVGRLVLGLPKEDCEKINKMIVTNLERNENAKSKEIQTNQD